MLRKWEYLIGKSKYLMESKGYSDTESTISQSNLVIEGEQQVLSSYGWRVTQLYQFLWKISSVTHLEI